MNKDQIEALMIEGMKTSLLEAGNLKLFAARNALFEASKENLKNFLPQVQEARRLIAEAETIYNEIAKLLARKKK